MTHFLDAAISELSRSVTISREEDGACMIRGKGSTAARVWKKRVYFFDNGRYDGSYDYKSHREAKFAALEWVVKNRI